MTPANLFDVQQDRPRRQVTTWQSEHAQATYEVETEDDTILRLRRIPKGVWVTSPTALRCAKEDILSERWVLIIPGIEDAPSTRRCTCYGADALTAHLPNDPDCCLVTGETPAERRQRVAATGTRR